MRVALAAVLALLVAAPAAAADAEHVQLLRGSPQALAQQNIRANFEDLTRLQNEADLRRFKELKLLVPLPSTQKVVVDRRIPARFRYCRPHVHDFLLDLADEYYRKWGHPLQINSAVRTAERQRQLAKSNKNAAPAGSGLRQSSHLTGSTVDISKLAMSEDGRAWMRTHLAKLERQGRIEATEEHAQAVFHVMVYNTASDEKIARLTQVTGRP